MCWGIDFTFVKVAVMYMCVGPVMYMCWDIDFTFVKVAVMYMCVGVS